MYTEAEQEAMYLATLQEEGEVEVYSDDYQEPPVDMQGQVIIRSPPPPAAPAPAVCPTMPPRVRTLKRKAGGSIPMTRLPPGELPTTMGPEEGSYYMTLGVPGRPTVRAVVCEDGELYIYPHDCLSAAGFKGPGESMMRLTSRFGAFDTKMMAYAGVSRNKITMGSAREVVKIMELYMGVCRKDKTEFAEVIRRLKTYIN